MSYSKRKKTSVNYNQDPLKNVLSKRQLRDPNEKILWLDDPHWTLLGLLWKNARIFYFSDEWHYEILCILAFRMYNNIPQLVVNAITQDGLCEKLIVNKDDINFQIWISSIIDRERRLKLMGWLLTSEIQMYKMPSNFTPNHKQGTIKYCILMNFCRGGCENECSCLFPAHFVKMQITKVIDNPYIGMIDCNIKYRTWSRTIKGQWCNDTLICDEAPEEPIYPCYEDFIIDSVRKAIYCGKDITNIEFLLPITKLPKDCWIDSLFYQKRKQYEKLKTLITSYETNSNNNNASMNKMMANNLLQRLFLRLSKNLKKPTTIFPQLIETQDNKKWDCMKEFIGILGYDYGLKLLLSDLDVELLNNEMDITFSIVSENTLKSLDISKTIQKYPNDHKSLQIVLPIKFRIIRKSEVIMFKSFKYQLVEDENQ